MPGEGLLFDYLTFEEAAEAAEAESRLLLSDFKLQDRYPAERDGCDAYVLRGCLTLEERRINIMRLRRHADTLAAETEGLIRELVRLRRQAGALEAETEDLIRQGVLGRTQEEYEQG